MQKTYSEDCCTFWDSRRQCYVSRNVLDQNFCKLSNDSVRQTLSPKPLIRNKKKSGKNYFNNEEERQSECKLPADEKFLSVQSNLSPNKGKTQKAVWNSNGSITILEPLPNTITQEDNESITNNKSLKEILKESRSPTPGKKERPPIHRMKSHPENDIRNQSLLDLDIKCKEI